MQRDMQLFVSVCHSGHGQGKLAIFFKQHPLLKLTLHFTMLDRFNLMLRSNTSVYYVHYISLTVVLNCCEIGFM